MPRPPATADPSLAELLAVDQALRSFGVSIDDAELRHIARGWDLTRAMVDDLYAVPDARYADPALRFRADPAVAGPPASPPG